MSDFQVEVGCLRCERKFRWPKTYVTNLAERARRVPATEHVDRVAALCWPKCSDTCCASTLVVVDDLVQDDGNCALLPTVAT